MRKLLFVVLIFALFCISFEQNDVDFNDEDILLEFSIKQKLKKLGKSLKKIPKKVKNNIGKVWKEVKRDVKKANKFLKDHGIYDLALKALKTLGKEAAVAVCVAEDIPIVVCQEMVDLVAKNI